MTAGSDEVQWAFARAQAHSRRSAVISHRSAAVLYGLWLPPDLLAHRLEVTTPALVEASRDVTSIQRGDVRAHRHVLPGTDVTSLDGLAVTTVERTWLDLAGRLHPADLIALGDSVLRAGGDEATMRDLVRRADGRRGVRNARRTLEFLDARSRSYPESRLRAGLVLNGLPPPAVNQAVTDGVHGWLAEPDLVYQDAQVALEYDGIDHLPEDRRRRDAGRLLALQRAGWEVRTYTWTQVRRDLEQIAFDVRVLLRRRAPRLLG